MIRVSQLSLPVHHSDKDFVKKLSKLLGIKEADIKEYYIVKQSVDARKKDDIRFSYTVQVKVENEERILSRNRDKNISLDKTVAYRLPDNGQEKLFNRPVIVGCGPAGLFAGLSLARKGMFPIIIEQGEDALTRKATVETFWKEGKLNPSSNVSFGEGGAGTFSDGKLNTLVKDETGRNTEVLRTFAQFGADEDILYSQHPHIGTDKLIEIITGIRREIERLGGEVRFNTALESIEIENNRIKTCRLSDGSEIRTDVLILAIGHSARQTFEMLTETDIEMQQKAFAVGLRIQHPQKMIDESQFGSEAEFLGPATYKLTAKTSDGRGVYSFCMCPGGYVCNASTEPERLAINGMSYHKRDSGTANSALIVSVTPEDFGSDDVLAGINFQRKLEKAAYEAADGRIPVQLLGDYIDENESTSFGNVNPCFKGEYAFARLDKAFPEFIHTSLSEVMPEFDRKIKGFGREDAILAGIESRTSSPVRITRDESFQSNVRGIYPCGEGAGYAGGITSAAMDGLKVAEAIIKKYSRWEDS